MTGLYTYSRSVDHERVPMQWYGTHDRVTVYDRKETQR